MRYPSKPSMRCMPVLDRMAWMNQHLIARSIDLAAPIAELKQIETELSGLLQECKRLGNSSHYIWHTREDEKVRLSHAQNDGKIFAWDDPPPTGHPGEDYNCRCWAEPLEADEYAEQILITPIVDNPYQWQLQDFVNHYVDGGGVPVSLSQTGYMGDIVEYFANLAIASDGLPGGYRAFNLRIIAKALSSGEGEVSTSFSRTYEFGDVFYVFGGSIVSGYFDGTARKEGGHLVINGIISYVFTDFFDDPFQIIENIDRIPGVSREDAIYIIELLNVNPDFLGTPYTINALWQTKFNATVKAY